MRLLIGLLLVLTTAAHTASAACGRPTEIRNAGEVRSAYLLLKSNRTLFVLAQECSSLQRAEAGRVLSMSILNRFPELPAQTAIVRVKSIRTFSTDVQLRRIKASRGEGFILPISGGALRALSSLNDVPLAISISQWNTIHASDSTPEQANGRLGETWHAYGTSEVRLPSTNPASFWSLPEEIEQSRMLVTAYVLRFEVNPSVSMSEIPFVVYAQPGVTKIDLELDSNIEALNGKYTININ